MNRKIIASSLAAVGAAVVVTSVALASGHHPAPPTPKLIVAQSDQLLPSESLSDWTSFADHFAVVTVVSERKLPASPDEIAAKEGFIPRAIKLRVDSTLWSRAGAPAAPKTFEIDLDGWSFKGNQLTPIRIEGEPMMTVGSQYAMPLVHLQASKRVAKAGWSPLAPDTIFPYQAGVLGHGEALPANQAPGNSPRGQYWGKSISALAAALRTTKQFPEVANARAATMPPDARAALVPEH